MRTAAKYRIRIECSDYGNNETVLEIRLNSGLYEKSENEIKNKIKEWRAATVINILSSQ